VDDGGRCHGFYVIYGCTVLTISKATEHLDRIWRYKGIPYRCPDAPISRYYTTEHHIKSDPRGGGSFCRCSINGDDGR
jgi:hypothetical protein